MPELVKVNLKLRAGDLNESLRRASTITGKLPSYLVNKACYQIARRAEANMPVVSQERITRDMERYKFVSRKNSSTIMRLTGAMSIILSSFYPNSNFNRKTGQVWLRKKPTFTGPAPTRRLKFWEYVNSEAARMSAARHSSAGFYRLGASVVKFIFHQGASVARGSFNPATGEALVGGGKVSKSINRIAGGTRALEGAGMATASFWVTTTEPDSKGSNTAIPRIMEPIWQTALDEETVSITEYAEKVYEQVLRDAGMSVK